MSQFHPSPKPSPAEHIKYKSRGKVYVPRQVLFPQFLLFHLASDFELCTMLSTLVHLLSVLLTTTVLASATTCEAPIPLLHHQFGVPSWQSLNYTCIGEAKLFTVKPSPGKGLGVFATRALEPGDIIIEEEPVFKITPPPFREGVGYPLSEVGLLVREEFELLSAEIQAEVLSLHAYTTAAEKTVDELVPIFRSNAYNSGKQIGLFPKIARINHSCRPNTSYFWNERLNRRVVYATRRIEEGQEILVSYIPLLHKHADRQKRLDQYGFKCSCDACAVKPSTLDLIDRRREAIRLGFLELESKLTLDAPDGVAEMKAAQKMAEKSAKVVKLVEEELLADYYANAYRIAAILHARIGEWRSATLWAHKSYQLRLMADRESKETEEMSTLTSRFISGWNDDLRNKSMSKK
jgi:hypothetical protein